VYGIFMAMLVANLLIFALLLLSIRVLGRIARLDPGVLAVSILALCFIGAYAMTTALSGVWIALGAGVLAYLGRRLGFPMVGFLLGLILGPMIEARLRQSLSLSDGSWMIFLERPIALVLCLAALAVLLWPLLQGLRHKDRER
jgi:putative tricarboxylic transport membrane protein